MCFILAGGKPMRPYRFPLVLFLGLTPVPLLLLGSPCAEIGGLILGGFTVSHEVVLPGRPRRFTTPSRATSAGGGTTPFRTILFGSISSRNRGAASTKYSTIRGTACSTPRSPSPGGGRCSVSSAPSALRATPSTWSIHTPSSGRRRFDPARAHGPRFGGGRGGVGGGRRPHMASLHLRPVRALRETGGSSRQ